jgi:hypothetical protein
MEVKIFRRHSADCPDKADRCASRYGCPPWGEFNWPDAGPRTWVDRNHRCIAASLSSHCLLLLTLGALS